MGTHQRFIYCRNNVPFLRMLRAGYIPQDRKAIIAYLEKIRSEYMHALVFWRYRVEPENKKERELEYQKTVLSCGQSVIMLLSKR